ncbi:uncharacterized protein LOC125821726 [Solanum verrucosum]|uniref:uncharacterized protein LOC125821726 n=1 Tax=Solanum verrucosum TaxID=315347 RepID=UPI0020D08C39|nr:uncharacterized protein LOC125821726 [Solanum verrucosum]
MEHDYCRFVKKCHKYEVHRDLIRVPPHKLNAIGSPWPFVAQGIDVIGSIEPLASNGHRFILVAIDYFTKWVEATSCKSVTEKVGADFVRNNLICQFGLLDSIITNNGANLNSHLMKEICEQFNITHQNLNTYHPQMKEAVEAANKNIKKILKKIIITRIIQETELRNVDWVRNRIEHLALIDLKRMTVVCHGQLYQQRMIRSFNKKVRSRTFEEGQLVLKRIFPHKDEYKGKFAPNSLGPYMVRKVLTGGALILPEMDGQEWPKPINTGSLKIYYVSMFGD